MKFGEEINIILDTPYSLKKDEKLFFQPRKGEKIHHLPESTDMLDILVKFGFFTSKTQASKNGFNKEIPDGYSQHTIGKLKRILYILKAKKMNKVVESKTESKIDKPHKPFLKKECGCLSYYGITNSRIRTFIVCVAHQKSTDKLFEGKGFNERLIILKDLLEKEGVKDIK